MKTLIWQGVLYQSIEYFNEQIKDENYIVESKIIGCYEDKIYAVDYSILIDKNWIVQNFLIKSEINKVKTTLEGKRHQDQWEINNVINPEFNDFKFIDISLTPFTNTLPINNLQLKDNSSKKIDVIYIDLLNQHIRSVQQQYTKTASHKYLYENIENDFKAEISVDDEGLVISYPKLFEKIAER